MTDVPLRCACGSLAGVVRVAPGGGQRLVCYCDDCQCFAHFLERAEDVLDAHGGTEIFQTSPARAEITRGAEHLACVRLREGGLLRWYSDCCRTAIGNTPPSPAMPFVGLIHTCLDVGASGATAHELLGPVRARVFGRFAHGDRREIDAHDGVLAPRAVLGLLAVILPALVRGDRRRSPFFRDSGAPAVAPRVLDAEALRAVQAARDSAHRAGGATA